MKLVKAILIEGSFTPRVSAPRFVLPADAASYAAMVTQIAKARCKRAGAPYKRWMGWYEPSIRSDLAAIGIKEPKS